MIEIPWLMTHLYVCMWIYIYIYIHDKEIHSGNINKITDHLPHFGIIKNRRNKLQKQKLKIRSMTTFNNTKYLNDIKELQYIT